MSKKSFKNIATSLTSVVFLIVGLSGVLLYFHLYESSVKELHEILGLVFVVAALLHIVANWKQMKGYFSKKTFIVVSFSVLLVSVSLVKFENADKPNPKKVLIQAMLQAPLEDAVYLLGSDINSVQTRFEKEGIVYEDAISISEVAKENKTSPFRIVGMILEQ